MQVGSTGCSHAILWLGRWDGVPLPYIKGYERAGFTKLAICILVEAKGKMCGSMPRARVYLDANIYKFSATRRLRLTPRETLVDWGETKQAVTVYDLVTVNPNEGITNNLELKREAELLPQVAALVGSERVEFLINIETQMQIWGLPNLDSETGRFYGAAHRVVEAPVAYDRIMFGGNSDYKEEQFRFLCSLRHDRFCRAPAHYWRLLG